MFDVCRVYLDMHLIQRPLLNLMNAIIPDTKIGFWRTAMIVHNRYMDLLPLRGKILWLYNYKRLLEFWHKHYFNDVFC